jgi:hypothetical protein
MPDSVAFDGVDDNIVIGNFPASFGDGAHTFVVVVRLTAFDSWDTIFGWNSEDGGFQFDSGSPAALICSTASLGHVRSDPIFDRTAELSLWMLLAYGKAAGITVPRFHKYVWATSEWTHAPSFNNEPVAGNNPALTALRASLNVPFPSQRITGQLLIAGIWESLLPDTTIETLIVGKQAWIDAAPDAAWRFDSATVLNTIAGSTTQTSRVGTSLAVGEAPFEWTDGAAGPPPQQIRPDADVTTTGWTTAPLYSKVDEAVADDGDFITGTAS